MPHAAAAPADDAVSFGALLRQHRRRRASSQEQLAFDAEVSTRHLSFLETGKARPSREMVLAHEGDGGGRRALLEEVLGYPDVKGLPPYRGDGPVVLVHLRRAHGDGRLSECRLFTMITTLGTPLDVTAQELAIESTFPADAASEAFIRSLAIKDA